jgi:glucan phosphoethanolaminetransferase (alkaline phosphatase superfamily)
MISQNKSLNFWKLRVLIKASLLSLSHLSPIYFLASTVVIDLVLIYAEYQLAKYPKEYRKCWIFANVMVNLALVMLVFLPIIILTLVLVSAIITLVILAEAIMHYYEMKTSASTEAKDEGELSEKNIQEKDEKKMWNVDEHLERGGRKTAYKTI